MPSSYKGLANIKTMWVNLVMTSAWLFLSSFRTILNNTFLLNAFAQHFTINFEIHCYINDWVLIHSSEVPTNFIENANWYRKHVPWRLSTFEQIVILFIVVDNNTTYKYLPRHRKECYFTVFIESYISWLYLGFDVIQIEFYRKTEFTIWAVEFQSQVRKKPRSS